MSKTGSFAALSLNKLPFYDPCWHIIFLCILIKCCVLHLSLCLQVLMYRHSCPCLFPFIKKQEKWKHALASNFSCDLHVYVQKLFKFFFKSCKKNLRFLLSKMLSSMTFTMTFSQINPAPPPASPRAPLLCVLVTVLVMVYVMVGSKVLLLCTFHFSYEDNFTV